MYMLVALSINNLLTIEHPGVILFLKLKVFDEVVIECCISYFLSCNAPDLMNATYAGYSPHWFIVHV